MRYRFALGLIMLISSGCVTPPKDSAPVLLDRAPLEAKAEQTPNSFSWPSSAWWKAFGDPQLDELVRQALTSAPTLKTAQARIGSASAAFQMRAAESGTTLSANAGLSRQRLSDSGLISSRLIGITWYNQADASLRLDFDFDWWGRERAGLEAAVSQAQAAAVERKAAELALVSAIVSNYLTWQIEARRVVAAQSLIDTLKALSRLQQLRVRQGIDAAETLDTLTMEEAKADDLITFLKGAVILRRLALASLLGIAPDQLRLPALGKAVVPSLEQPPDAGLGIISRRPDIVASRWRVEAATQGVAEARAGYYPDIRLSALGGLSGTDVSKFFNPGSRVASIGAALYLPIFDSRRVKARYGIQHAEMELAIANYNETVVAAAQDIAIQVLNGQGLPKRHRDLLKQLDAALDLEKSSADLARQGIVDDRSALKAKTEVLHLQDATLQAENEVVLARIALIKALGGGMELVTPTAPGENGRRSLSQ